MIVLCRQASELHTEADEGKLTGAKKLAYAFHMTLCGPCQRYREQLRVTAKVVAGAPKDEASVPDGLVDRLADELAKKG
jgi:hypothetical protein